MLDCTHDENGTFVLEIDHNQRCFVDFGHLGASALSLFAAFLFLHTSLMEKHFSTRARRRVKSQYSAM